MFWEVVLFCVLSLTGALAQDVGALVSKDMFERMLLHRNDANCQAKGFYTYDAFITAARSFRAFGTTGDTNTRKKEIAAFLAQTSHETTGIIFIPFQSMKLPIITQDNISCIMLIIRGVGNSSRWSIFMGILLQARTRQSSRLLRCKSTVALCSW